MAKASITIEDVARAAGVSRQTVSRVINRQSNVNAKTRERVETAIAALGYIPNIAARRMGGSRSYILLALIERAAARAAGGHLPLGEMMLAGIDACTRHDYHLMFDQLDAGDANHPQLVTRLVTVLGAVQPDGVIIMPPLDRNTVLLGALEQRGIVSTCLGERVEFGRRVPGLDEANFGEAAAQRFVDLGHRQVGFVAGVAEPARSRRRIEGYRRAMARAGSRAHRHFVADKAQDFNRALELARSWLLPTIRPTAIIAETPEIAAAFLEVAKELKLSVPGELSLLSLNDSAMLERAVPAISVLHQAYGEMFAKACDRLIALSAGEDASPPNEGFEFIERRSLAKAPRAV